MAGKVRLAQTPLPVVEFGWAALLLAPIFLRGNRHLLLSALDSNVTSPGLTDSGPYSEATPTSNLCRHE